MTISSRRLKQIIARRKLARPKRQIRHLQNLGYQLDAITEDFPTTETPYEREPFIYDPYPEIYDIPPTDEEYLNRNRQIKFGTITEYPIDNKPYTHPSGSNFPPSAYPDWNRHAPILLDFFNFLDTTTDGVQKGEIIAEYWNGHFRAPPVEAIIQEQLAARARIDRRIVPVPPVPAARDNEEDNTIPNDITVNNNDNHPYDEYSTSTSTSSSDSSTPSKRQKRFNSYVPGPCVPCTFNSSVIPGRLLDTGIFGTTYLTHLDTSGRQFTLLPDTDYHFNDVTISLRENRTGLNIVAVCPEVIDVATVPDTIQVPTNNTTDSLPETPRYTFRPINRTTSYETDGDSDTTPPPFYKDPDYTPSDEESEDEEPVETGTNNSGPSNNTNESSDSESTANSTKKAVAHLSLPDAIDLTASDTDDDSAGDIILLHVKTSTEHI
jgi:hypothetical protein